MALKKVGYKAENMLTIVADMFYRTLIPYLKDTQSEKVWKLCP
jgi:hypothetical protein